MKVNSINYLISGIVFFITFLVYFATMAPTVSYWDCGEFIATSYILGVPHPPGSPLFLIIGRIFSLFPISSDIAFRVNMISPIASALSVMLLYLIIVQLINIYRGSIKNNFDKIIVFGSAFISSLIFAFTDSHWFNAVEAEVYSLSTLSTAIVAWLILYWNENSNKKGNERFLLLISYVLGLATGIHLLNLLALPFMGMIFYFKRYSYTTRSFLIMSFITAITFITIYLGIIKGIPRIASLIGINGLIITLLFLLITTIYVIIKRNNFLSFILSSLVLVIVGYSTYAVLFIRSAQDPAIDENDPETVERAIKYLDREQYGELFTFPRRYEKGTVGSYPHKVSKIGNPLNNSNFSSSQEFRYMFHDFEKQFSFFWDYQFIRMYLRYFLWQFAGRGPAGENHVSNFGALEARAEDGVNWFQFILPLPFFMGLLGIYHHFKKDPKRAWSVLALFVMTGFALIIYLNQDKFQPRERDYSYVGSFFAYSVWIGIFLESFFDKLFKIIKNRKISNNIFYFICSSFLIIPSVMYSSNYWSHDRSGNFVAWDYSYNILQTCEPNAVIFTNGDNDTFPLWYLQEVEGIRKDVTVANLSLLNTDWYIKQIKDQRTGNNKIISFSDKQINNEEPIGINPATGNPLLLKVDIWKDTPVSIPVINNEKNFEGKVSWTIKPTLGAGGIRVQDLMVLHIIQESKWEIPIYFAVTVSPSNRIGLEDYLQMEGLAFKLNSHKVSSVNFEKLEENLISDVKDLEWYNKYHTGYKYRNLNNENVYLNPNIQKLLQNYRSAFLQLSMYKYDQINSLTDFSEKEELKNNVIEILDYMSLIMPENVVKIGSPEMKLQIAQLYHGVGDSLDQDKARGIFRQFHSSTRPEIIGFLLQTYNEFNYNKDAIEVLEKWLTNNPNDQTALSLLNEWKQRD